MKDTYLRNGVLVNKVSMNEGSNLAVTYNGLLYQSGADHIYAHYGYGGKWSDNKTLKMLKTDSGFRANIPLTKTGTINMVFKDSANNWDNNNGENYSFDIRTRKATSKD